MRNLILLLTFGLASCAVPGKADLAAHSMTETITMAGQQDVIAACITRNMDSYPGGFATIPLVVTRMFPSPDGKSTELESTQNTNNLMMLPEVSWVATITQTDGNTSQVALMTRTNVTPFLAASYVYDRVKPAVMSCATP